jgi:SAM-dependent methyltransferase
VDKLCLGCGNEPLAGAVNHDRIKHRPEVDVAHDLNHLPWPWGDRSFDLIVAASVFEHLDIDLVKSVDECWRILRPGGQLYLKLPHWQSDVSWRDPTHRWRFTLHSVNIFDPDTEYGRDYAFYTARKWRLVSPAVLNKAGSSIHVTLEVRK